jgi:hypothetical protein
VPNLLDTCVNQTFYYEDGKVLTHTDEATIFYCVQVFSISIEGMIFIMFFHSLYFDMVGSENYNSLISRQQRIDNLQVIYK